MKRKEPSDLQINYPANRATPGHKAKARATARMADQKTFVWHCPSHGMAMFSTAGSGTCRQCLAAAQRNTKTRKRAAERNSLARPTEQATEE